MAISRRTRSNKLPLLFLGAVLWLILLACTGPDFRRPIDDPIMTPMEMESELEELRELNLTVGNEEFDPRIYPLFAGIDTRNGKTLIKKFICWDGCPELGKVYLVYQGVDTEESCYYAMGDPLFSGTPIQGEFWGCLPILDWLTVPSRRPS